jgi:hypoxia up-regulated 1
VSDVHFTVTNFQSKRKTPTSIAFYKGERLFGSDATALSGRKPESSISKLQRMLGRDVDHPLVQEILKEQYFPYKLYKNETTGLTTITVDNNQSYTSEELMAMILQHVKDMTVNFGAHAVKDCVITVPSSFTQHEREALYSAAEIANLNVLGLIEENTAAALHYGMDHVFEEPKNVLYYNLGAGSLQVSVVHYSSYTVKESGNKNKTVGQFEVLGKAYDNQVGGFQFDLKLTEIFANRFNEIWSKKASGKGKDIKDFIRPMIRLKNEASKVKEVLSANNEFPVRLEQLHADVDLATKITRKDFEEAAEPLFARLLHPIEQALEMANITLADIHAVELLGGAVRMPKVKKILDDYFKPSNIVVGQHLNGDEAMALGSAFHAANLSTSFKVRKVGMQDTSLFGVAVRLENLPVATPAESGGLLGKIGGLFGSSEKKSEESTADTTAEGDAVDTGKWEKSANLFPRKSIVPSKTKTVAFHHDQDILCKIEYDSNTHPILPEGTHSLLAEYNITGISAFAKEAQEKGHPAPKVHLSFSVDRSGIAKLVKAEATIDLPLAAEIPAESIEGDANKDSKEPVKEEEKEKTSAEGATETNTGDANTADKDKEKEKDSKKDTKKDTKKAKADNVLRRVLTVVANHKVTIPPKWTHDLVLEARARLHALNVADEERRAKAAAMNDLEAFIYRVKNRLEDDEKKLQAISTDDQRQAVRDFANEIEEWLYDDGRDQTVSVYKEKLSALQTKADEIFHRFEEIAKREEAVTKVKTVLNDIRQNVLAWKSENSMPQITEEEMEELLGLVQKSDDWIEEKVASQEKHSPYETPLFKSSEVYVQAKKARELHMKLMKKPKPVPPKVVEQNTTDSSNSTEEVKVEVNVDGESEVKVEVEKDAGAQEQKEDSANEL